MQVNRSIGSGYVYGHTKLPNSIQHAQIHIIRYMVRDGYYLGGAIMGLRDNIRTRKIVIC